MKMAVKEKKVSESVVETNNIVLPSHANAQGSVFGGTIMGWIDICAAICAQRHAGLPSVTASVDTLNFISPVRVGDTVTLKARMVYTGKTSMMIAVDVWANDPLSGKTCLCVSAYLTFVALDRHGKPTRIPGLKLETEDEKKDFAAAAERRRQLLSNRPNK